MAIEDTIKALTKEASERFLKYVSIPTASDENSGTSPSTGAQYDLAEVLSEELKNIGIPEEDVYYDDQLCYVYATVKGDPDLPKIGFISHMDTSPECSGENIKPQIIRNYDGSDIALGSSGKVLSTSSFPELKEYIGQTIITTDGTTLLGADDKAGIAEIMCAVEYIVNHPEFKHGPIRIGFTPDEEIGEGVLFLDPEQCLERMHIIDPGFYLVIDAAAGT